MLNKPIICSGTSMFPFIKVGDRVHVRKTPWDRLEIGDLVVLKTSGSGYPIIHRLVGWRRVGSNRFGILKGDNLLYTDNFLLEQNNYLGRVWSRERNGELTNLKSFSENVRARLVAFLSVWSLTPGIVRTKIKLTLESWMPRIPGIRSMERFFLKKTRCFLFSEQGNRKRLRLVYKEMVIGEIIFQDKPVNIISCNVFSVFYTFISPKNLIAHTAKEFPELFNP